MSIEHNTRILREARSGDESAKARLLELVYDRLRKIAGGYVRRIGHPQTLQGTDIVHEAYLSLVDHENLSFEDRSHFIAIAARAMRQVMVDYARRKYAIKRGGGREREPLRDTIALTPERDVTLLSLDEALEKLAELHPRQARIVELRFFGGLKLPEVAAALDVSLRTVEGDWHAAKAWLFRELDRD